MKILKKVIVIDAAIFLAAGIITVVLGKFTAAKYGTILLLCGLVPMAIAIVAEAGSKHRPSPYAYRPKISVSQQHLRDKNDFQTRHAFFLTSLLVGIIPVVTGLLLMHLSYLAAK